MCSHISTKSREFFPFLHVQRKTNSHLLLKSVFWLFFNNQIKITFYNKELQLRIFPVYFRYLVKRTLIFNIDIFYVYLCVIYNSFRYSFGVFLLEKIVKVENKESYFQIFVQTVVDSFVYGRYWVCFVINLVRKESTQVIWPTFGLRPCKQSP